MAANAAALGSVACQRFLSLKTSPLAAGAESGGSASFRSRPASSLPVIHRSTSQTSKRSHLSWRTARGGAGSGRGSVIVSVALEDPDIIFVRSGDATDQQEGLAAVGAQEEDVVPGNGQVGGFAFEGGATSFGDVGVGFSSSPGSSSSSPPPTGTQVADGEDLNRMVDRAINATIVLAAGTAAITKLLTIDHDYWHVGHGLANLRPTHFACSGFDLPSPWLTPAVNYDVPCLVMSPL
ncbi:hypothetical protein Taro_010134 [Colocasia esculenta]|uniref:Uncharacterized protein n=1 Tax=Colocasia esculenta TaxID=4460 RepID=A0A843U277_COLES|nr:hypothetical protein [Colocasia esculenta]